LKRQVRTAFDLQRHRAASFSVMFFVGLVAVVLIKNPNLAWSVVQNWYSLLWLSFGSSLVYFLVACSYKYFVPSSNVISSAQLVLSENSIRPASSLESSLILPNCLEIIGERSEAKKLDEVFKELLVTTNLEELRYKAKRCLFYLGCEVEQIDEDTIIEILIDQLVKTNHSKQADLISRHFLYLVENNRIVE